MIARHWSRAALGLAMAAVAGFAAASGGGRSMFTSWRAPAGALPSTRHVALDGLDAAVISTGRLVTPAGVEVGVEAPKPFGLALSPDGKALATINSGASRFSVTLVTDLASATPTVRQVPVDATFMGVVFSPDGSRFYAAGGEDGTVWVGDTTGARLVGAVNLNGESHPLAAPLDPTSPSPRFKGSFPGRLALSRDGRYLFAVDQGAFQVQVLDTTRIATGVDGDGKLVEPNNFGAVVSRIGTGRYPFDVALSKDGRKLFVANVGTFQYHHLTPESPTGDPFADFPLCIPGAGYPDESGAARVVHVSPVDPRNLPDALQDPFGIRCGYVKQAVDLRLPGLGSPNAPESNSVWSYDVTNPLAPVRERVVRTGPPAAETLAAALRDDPDDGPAAYAGPHPNTVLVGDDRLYVANGNDDSIAVLPLSGEGRAERIALSPLRGPDRHLRGVQPVALALSPDGRTLYAAEAGLNAVAVIRLEGRSGRVLGHIPTGWWPAALAVSADGRTLYVSNARGRGAGPNTPTPPDDLGSPKHSVLGSVSIIPVPGEAQLAAYTQRVLANNGLVAHDDPAAAARFRAKLDWVRRSVKHVIFINKENATHDLLLGDITATTAGTPVNGEPSYSLGPDASPNHHALALRFAFSDNFYLEPSVSSDGHRWLTNTYTSELEETHWPASYGGRRNDAGDDPAVFVPYPGRLGFTDANASPEPNDLNQHGSIYLHLARHGRTFVNFGNGFEFAEVDETNFTEPTGIRNHVDVPMEKVVRDHTDHLYPEFNTSIPDAPLPEDPTRFNRYGRFEQVFRSRFVKDGQCRLPDYVDLYYPNDHGGGADDMYPDGSHPWSFTRYVQDNDDALGRTIQLLSESPCWKDTVVFVVEDDAQNGYDHVDGHRSLFLAIGPTVKPGYLLRTHASLSSIFKTVDLVFDLPPLNLYDAAATDLLELFADPPSRTSPAAEAGAPPFRRIEPARDTSRAASWRAATRGLDFRSPDAQELDLREAIRASEGLPRKAKHEE